ncbi:MAG: hypothetical protein E6Q99_10180 [Elusimicrobia bacterium]|nr:MAG: hypothetical protein E6Q99_10180 [Elusimicrobiota bacterium]
MNPPRSHRARAGARGLTLAELVVTSFVIGLMAVVVSLFVTQTVRSLTRGSARQKGQDLVRYAMVVLERDFNDMTEVRQGDLTTLEFYMDSRRAPWYDPFADTDADGLVNYMDPDDDGDALEAGWFDGDGRGILSFANAPAAVPWRSGFDLDDDDENGDGNRDVICRYRYLASSQTIVADFRYDEGGWTDEKTILTRVTNFAFDYRGSIDGLQGVPVGSADTNNDRLLSWDEMEDLDGTAGPGGTILNNFNERRYVSIVSVNFQVRVNPKIDVFTPIRTEMSPPLLSVKRKYP